MVDVINGEGYDSVLITHGTDTLIESARYLAKRITNRCIILTGAVQPWCLKQSDAEINIGMSLGFLIGSTYAPQPIRGVFVCLSGKILPANNATRDPTGTLCTDSEVPQQVI